MSLSSVVHHPRSLTGRNRCCVKITLSWRLQGNLCLVDVTPTRLLQAGKLGHGRQGKVSYWLPLPFR